MVPGPMSLVPGPCPWSALVPCPMTMIVLKNKKCLNRLVRRAFELIFGSFCIIFSGGSFLKNHVFHFSCSFFQKQKYLNRLVRRAFELILASFCIIFFRRIIFEKNMCFHMSYSSLIFIFIFIFHIHISYS